MVGITKLLGLFKIDKFGIDDVVLSLPPFEELQILL